MANNEWKVLFTSAMILGVALSGDGGTALAHSALSQHAAVPKFSSANPMESMSQPVGGTRPIAVSDLLIGAAASPPMGKGNGEFLLEQVRKPMNMAVQLASGANAFQIGIEGNVAYVPTLQGTTYVVKLTSHKLAFTFSTPRGARIANVSKNGRLLIITGAKSVTAYSLPSLKRAWQVNKGGNALSLSDHFAYLSGNSSKVTSIINLKTGKITGEIPVGMIEDSVYDPQQHTLWMANWTSGNMTVVDTRNQRVVKVIHEKEGGGFSVKDMGSMSRMMMAKGGFMQLAAGPNGKHVYAASFSGNIMVYDAVNNAFEKNIPTVPMAKLSGIAIDPSGQYAYTTVENKKETIAVSLKTGKVASTFTNLESNRWYVVN